MKNKLKELRGQLEELEIDKEEVQEKIDSFELDEDDYEDQYIEMLDEEEVIVCGMAFCPSRILSELDPTAYACGLSDYVDGIDKEEDEEYKELVEELESLETQVITLEEEIEELENEIEDEIAILKLPDHLDLLIPTI